MNSLSSGASLETAMTDTPVRYGAADLRHWVSSVFQAVGIDPGDADETARVLVRTNLRGVDTHGVSRVDGYVQKIESGEVNRKPSPSSSFRDGVLYFDGDGGLGQAVATNAVREAVARAADASVVTCLIQRSGHLAALGQFVLEAAERGMVAIMCQETPPLMALAGSTRPSIGNNPIAFSCPIKGSAPLLFDMATSVVARGNVLQAIREGKTEIPDHWAIGPDGNPTSDPRVALQGAMLPIAGHKGMGLAMLVQILAGSLTGSRALESAAAHGSTSSAGNVSAFLLIINPDRVVGGDVFDSHVRQWLGVYLAAAGVRGRYPGQRAAECEAERELHGIPIPQSTILELAEVGQRVGRPFKLQPQPDHPVAGQAANE